MSNRVLFIQEENCTGCRMCELTCSSAREGAFNPLHSRIRVVTGSLEGWSRPSVCLQCEDAMCMAVCPVDAIGREKTPRGDSFIAVDKERCTGCHRCVAACPFGAIEFFKDLGPLKCDLCGGSPACVDFCFYDCLCFVELSDEEYRNRAKRIRALTIKACRDIGRDEPHRRRAAFSRDASRVTITKGGGG
jgi:carbon-monoxide dehydrogenase iron sulfur subunit